MFRTGDTKQGSELQSLCLLGLPFINLLSSSWFTENCRPNWQQAEPLQLQQWQLEVPVLHLSKESLWKGSGRAFSKAGCGPCDCSVQQGFTLHVNLGHGKERTLIKLFHFVTEVARWAVVGEQQYQMKGWSWRWSSCVVDQKPDPAFASAEEVLHDARQVTSAMFWTLVRRHLLSSVPCLSAWKVLSEAVSACSCNQGPGELHCELECPLRSWILSVV